MTLDKETTEFILEAIEKLSLGILTSKYDSDEIYEIHQTAGIYLFELQKGDK